MLVSVWKYIYFLTSSFYRHWICSWSLLCSDLSERKKKAGCLSDCSGSEAELTTSALLEEVSEAGREEVELTGCGERLSYIYTVVRNNAQNLKLLAEHLDKDKFFVCIILNFLRGVSVPVWTTEHWQSTISVASRVLVCAGGGPGDSLFVQKITFCLVESFLLKKPPWEGRGGRTGDRIERNDLWNKQRKLGSVRQNVLSVLNLKGTLTEN